MSTLTKVPFRSLRAGDYARILTLVPGRYITALVDVRLVSDPKPADCCECWVADAVRVDNGKPEFYHRLGFRLVELIARGAR